MRSCALLLTFLDMLAIIICAFRELILNMTKVTGRFDRSEHVNRRFIMPVAIEFTSSRSKKVAVDVVPADWQNYIAQ